MALSYVKGTLYTDILLLRTLISVMSFCNLVFIRFVFVFTSFVSFVWVHWTRYGVCYSPCFVLTPSMHSLLKLLSNSLCDWTHTWNACYEMFHTSDLNRFSCQHSSIIYIHKVTIRICIWQFDFKAKILSFV